MQDWEFLEAGVCPDCQNPIDSTFIKEGLPWCKICDVYFEKVGGYYIRNTNAESEYKILHDEMKKEKPK